MSVGLSLQSLTQEFEQTRERLRVVEDDIKKHTGRRNVPQSANFRHPRDAPPGLRSQLANRLDDGPLRRRTQGGAFSRLGRQLNLHEAQRMGRPPTPPTGPSGPHQGPAAAKEQNRLGPEPGMGPRMGVKRDRVEREPSEDGELDEAPPRKVGLLSSIGASSLTVKGKSRIELLNEQSGDQNIKARNRRMFGMILGTLKSFEKEEITKRKEQVDKKVEKEQKVEEQKEREREEAVRLRRELIEEKRDKQIKLRHLQAKMEVVGAFEEFSKRHGYMANFIHTAAKPPLMWLPRLMTAECEESLLRSRAKIEAIVQKEQQRVELELERIEGIQRDSDGEIDGKENACGTSLPSSVAVVVNTDAPEDAEKLKQNGGAPKEKAAVDPDMKNIKIVIENDLAVKKDVNGDDSVYGEVDDETADHPRDDKMEHEEEEEEDEDEEEEKETRRGRNVDEARHASEATNDEKAREYEPMNTSYEDDEPPAKHEHVDSKREQSKSRSRTPPPPADVSQNDGHDQPSLLEPSPELRRSSPRRKSPASSVDEEPHRKDEPPEEKLASEDVPKRDTSPAAGDAPRRSRTPTKARLASKKKRRGSSSSSSSSSTSRASNSSSSSDTSATSSSGSSSSEDSPRRQPRKAGPQISVEGGPRKRSRSPPSSAAKKSPPNRGRRPSSSPRPMKRRNESPVGRRSPKRRSRSPRRRSPGGSPPRRDASVKRRSVSRRRSPSVRRRRRSSSAKRRSVSGGRRRLNRPRSGSRGPGRRSPIRRRSRSRSPKRPLRRSRSPRRRR